MATAVPETACRPEEDTGQCGYQTATGGTCQNPAGDDGRCWLATHADGPDVPETEPDGRGAPEGNQNAVGNAGGGAPEGNTNAVTHGLHTAAENPCGLYRHYRQSEPDVADMVRRWFWSYLAATPRLSRSITLDAPHSTETDAATAAAGVDPARLQGVDRQLFVTCVRQAAVARATMSQSVDGLTRTETRQTTDGREYTVTRENPANRLKSQLREQNLRVLEKTGVFDADGETTEQAWIAAAERLGEQEESAGGSG